jgi:hypothetical protein
MNVGALTLVYYSAFDICFDPTESLSGSFMTSLVV